MLLSLDLETECTVKTCKHFGRSLCDEGHSLSPWHSKITVIGIVGVDHPHIKQIFRGSDKISKLNEWITDLEYDGDTKVEFVGHNFKFDLLHLNVHGANIPMERWVACTQLMAYVSTDKISDSWLADYEYKRTQLANKSANRKAGKHSLKTLAPYHLGVQPFWETADHDNDEYVLRDAEYTARLYPVLKAQLEAKGEFDFYQNKQLPWTKMLLAAELRGVELDLQGIDKKEAELENKAKELIVAMDKQWDMANKTFRANKLSVLSDKYEKMATKAGKPFNYGSRYWKLCEMARDKANRNGTLNIKYSSPKQALWLLRDYLGYDCQFISPKKNKNTGKLTYEGADSEVLERLVHEGKSDAAVLLEWRETNKAITSFLRPWREQQSNGVIHPIFNPANTKTGRTSSERPNCQQVPSDLRPLFKSREGYSFIGYDAAAIEAKLIALYSDDPELFHIIDQGISIHDYNTKIFLGIDAHHSDIKKHYAKERAATKNVGFALFYNAGANRIRTAYAEKGFHLSLSECKEIHQRFKKTYKVAYECANSVVKHMEIGEPLANSLGRPLAIANVEDCYMTAFNMLIQSSASDLLLEGAHRAWELMKSESIEATPVLFVHDFVSFEVKDKDVEKANSIIVRSLTNFNLETANGPIVLEVDGGVSTRWEK